MLEGQSQAAESNAAAIPVVAEGGAAPSNPESQQPGSQSAAPSDTGGKPKQPTVPYDRFAEVNKEFRETQAKLARYEAELAERDKKLAALEADTSVLGRLREVFVPPAKKEEEFVDPAMAEISTLKERLASFENERVQQHFETGFAAVDAIVDQQFDPGVPSEVRKAVGTTVKGLLAAAIRTGQLDVRALQNRERLAEAIRQQTSVYNEAFKAVRTEARRVDPMKTLSAQSLFDKGESIPSGMNLAQLAEYIATKAGQA